MALLCVHYGDGLELPLKRLDSQYMMWKNIHYTGQSHNLSAVKLLDQYFFILHEI
jgi:hypothetical protein